MIIAKYYAAWSPTRLTAERDSLHVNTRLAAWNCGLLLSSAANVYTSSCMLCKRLTRLCERLTRDCVRDRHVIATFDIHVGKRTLFVARPDAKTLSRGKPAVTSAAILGAHPCTHSDWSRQFLKEKIGKRQQKEANCSKKRSLLLKWRVVYCYTRR